jgi:hypothetical protein
LASYFGLFAGYRTGRKFCASFERYYDSDESQQADVIAPIISYKESL